MEQIITVISEEKLRKLMEEVVQNLVLGRETKNEDKVEYLTRKQVTKMIGISLTTVDKWRKDKILRSHKPAGRVRFIKSEVHEDMQKQNFHN